MKDDDGSKSRVVFSVEMDQLLLCFLLVAHDIRDFVVLLLP